MMIMPVTTFAMNIQENVSNGLSDAEIGIIVCSVVIICLGLIELSTQTGIEDYKRKKKGEKVEVKTEEKSK